MPTSDDESLDRGRLNDLQRRKLAELLRFVRVSNPFYRAKLVAVSNPDDAALEFLPLTTRAELEIDQVAHPPYGSNLTYPQNHYVRLHQTSGSGGAPLRWLDTPYSWAWFKKCWRIIYGAAGVSLSDRVFFPFSFGPFVGFWAAFETAIDLGCFCLPAGGMSTKARLEYMLVNEATVVCCTPTYALRMAEAAQELKIDLASSPVKALFVAGEPGGCVESFRKRLQSAWGARVFDHSGMTEMGSCSFECRESPAGLHVIESEFIPEVIDPETTRPTPEGNLGELVLTNLGRWGSPLIRYRTGDLVKLLRGRCACGRWFARLDGGILGRVDEMTVIRGNNVYPSAIENVIRAFPEVSEFRLILHSPNDRPDLEIEVEPAASTIDDRLSERIIQAVKDRLQFRPKVSFVKQGSLPRFEMKSRRFLRRET